MTEKKEKRKASTSGLKALLSPFHVDIDYVNDGVGVSVTGAVGISEYSPECVGISTASCRLSVTGSALTLVTYEHGCVSVRGDVSEVRLSRDKHR